MNIILFGFKGCGKTHFGQLLAKKTGRQFIDTDAEILQQQEYKTIRELHQTIGELAFRQLETNILHKLKGVQSTIIALGGGTILSTLNQDLLHPIGHLIYLQASFSQIKTRILEKGLPSFAPTIDTLRDVFESRCPIYESIPAQRIPTDILDEQRVLAVLESIIDPKDSINGF